MKAVVHRCYFGVQAAAMRGRWTTRAFFRVKNTLYSRRRKRLEGLLRRFDLRPGDIAIDCGANVGNVAEVMLAAGATVYAFEPNPFVFPILRNRLGRDTPRITCIPKGVWTQQSTLRMYHDPRCQADPARWSVTSSIHDGNTHVEAACHSDIELVDLAGFITVLGRRVKLIKLDVEGAEFDILNHLIDTGVVDQIEHIVAETHESAIPGLEESRARLLGKLADSTDLQRKIALDWI